MIGRAIPAALLFSVAAGILLLWLPTDSHGESRHLSLLRSEPVADTVMAESPLEVRLWFSEAPRQGTTSIRLLDSSGELVHTADPAADPEDDTAHFVRLHHAVGPGTYSIVWRTMSRDGHVVNGEGAFTVITE